MGVNYLLRMAVDTTDPIYPGNELVVTTELDSVAGSLREKIGEAVNGDIITFDPSLSGNTIRLTGGRLIVDTTLTIDGSSLPDKITLSGDKTGDGRTGDDTELFEFEPGNEIVLDSLNLVDGYDTSKDGGGCIDSDSGLTIRNCLIANCATPDSNTRDNGGAAIYVFSGPYLILEDCTVNSNEAGDVTTVQPASPGGAFLIVDATTHINPLHLLKQLCRQRKLRRSWRWNLFQ